MYCGNVFACENSILIWLFWCFAFELDFIVSMYCTCRFVNANGGEMSSNHGYVHMISNQRIILWQLSIYAINKHTYPVNMDSLPNRTMISIAKILKKKQNIQLQFLLTDNDNCLIFDRCSVEALCIASFVVHRVHWIKSKDSTTEFAQNLLSIKKWNNNLANECTTNWINVLQKSHTRIIAKSVRKVRSKKGQRMKYDQHQFVKQYVFVD